MPPRYRQRAGVETQILNHAAVLVDGARDLYFATNHVGARVWELMAQPRDVEEMLSDLLARFDVDPQRCRTEIAAFLADLERQRLLETVDS